MDLSRFKWPLIIVAVCFVIWLGTSGGVNYMVGNFTKATVGQDAARDKTDEAGLTRVAGFLLYTFRYEGANQVMQMAIERYGEDGANYWFNVYRTAKCYEKFGDYQRSYDILQELIAANASTLDDRVPNNDNLTLRANKLKEVHELS